MIVLYIETNMQKKRYVCNVSMIGTINKKTRVRHMVLLIR
jgi:hypothetical protein